MQCDHLLQNGTVDLPVFRAVADNRRHAGANESGTDLDAWIVRMVSECSKQTIRVVTQCIQILQTVPRHSPIAATIVGIDPLQDVVEQHFLAGEVDRHGARARNAAM